MMITTGGWILSEPHQKKFISLLGCDMLGVLGNFSGKVKPWYLPFDWVFCRIPIKGKVRTVIVRNKATRNVYGLPVEVIGREIIGIWGVRRIRSINVY